MIKYNVYGAIKDWSSKKKIFFFYQVESDSLDSAVTLGLGLEMVNHINAPVSVLYVEAEIAV